MDHFWLACQHQLSHLLMNSQQSVRAHLTESKKIKCKKDIQCPKCKKCLLHRGSALKHEPSHLCNFIFKPAISLVTAPFRVECSLLIE